MFLDAITRFLNLSLWGAVLAAGAAFGVWLLVAPAARLVPALARRAAVLAAFIIAAFAAGHIHGAAGGRNAKLELNRIQAELALAKKRARELSLDAQVRLLRANELQQQVDDYAADIKTGVTTACPSDAAYTRRMRQILQR